MSNPTTPQRPGRVSPDSTPSSTRSDMSPVQLTPRSKVRAMLAAFSDDSEDDSELGPRKAAEIAGTVSKAQYSIGRKATAEPSARESSDSEDSSVSMKPRGRLVSRMFAGKADPPDDSEERDPLPASEQAKKGGPKESVDISKKASSESPAGNYYDSDGATRPLRRKLTKSYGSYENQTSTPPNVRKSSPGLFVSPGPASNDLSPTRATNTGESNHVECDSDSDLPENLAANARFMALVERKRQERLAKEAEAARKEKSAQSRRIDSYGLDDDEESGNSATEERLTQQARPTRKASKKALEEMRRETQRIARNMQLAHEARTKKKITKQSLFEKFNFRPELRNTGNSGVGGGHSPATAAAAPCSSSAAGSDAERVHSTPPTSPAYHDGPSPKSDLKAVGICADRPKGKLLGTTHAKDSLTAENHIRRSPASPTLQSECPRLALATNGVEGSDGEHKDAPKLDKGKGRAVGPPGGSFAVPGTSKKAIFTQPPIRVRPPKRIETNGFDSESDLEIVRETKPRKYTVFDKCPRQEERQSNSLHALRLLASPGRKNPKVLSITPVELQHDLRRRARQQAAQDREERLQQLRDRGVILPTAEEREKDAEVFDDLVAKAREEADVIMKREKAAARKERKERGEADPLEESSAGEDDNWADDEEHSESELSGSDDGDECEEDDAEDDEQPSGRDGEEEKEDENPSVAALLDDEASQDYGSDDEMEDIPTLKRRKGMHTRIVSDDEEEDNSGSAAVSFARIKPNKQIIPGLPVSSAAPLGLTQMFAATMADSQVEGAESDQQEQDSLTYLRDLPAPSLPDFGLTRLEDGSQEAIKDSQADRDETHSQDQHSLGPRIDLHYSQSQVQYDSVPLSATQISEFPDPSQDSGFQKSSPIKRRFATTQPSSPEVPQGPERTVTTETVESPAVHKRGRLRRRMEVQVFSDEENTSEENEHGKFEIETNAFDVMRKASKKMLTVPDNFDKAKSEAKAMVDEQALESEDEYAGLGGASGDDESESGEGAAQLMDMIDDDGKTIVNEREIAAFYA
jgi:mediator of replication checkpoint protein 1